MASGSNSRGFVLLLITSCFFITGLLFDYMPMIIDDHIKRTIELATNEEIIDFWSRPPIEVHSYYWLYDIPNAEQFLKAGEKPQVRKVGPFHFTSRIEKRLIELSANKFRVTYNSTRYMTLNESYSARLLDEPIQLLNPILCSIIEGVRVNGRQLDGQSRAVAMGSVGRLIERYNESIVASTTPRLALLGRPMPIVDKLRRIADTFGMADRLPDMPPAGTKLGYVALVNGTWSGPFEIYTGYQETAQSLGDIISYKGKRRLDYYEGKCNRLQVSAGELRPMPIDPEQKLEIFNPGFCRVAHLQPTSVVKLREGQAIKYKVAPEDLLSARSNPDNRCFCTNVTEADDHCSLDGVVELAPCSYDAPMLLTLSNVPLDSRIGATIRNFDPHLLRGDVEQLPDADDQAQFVVLKRVGVPIKADLTVTLMMKVIRDPAFKQTANVPEVSYVPLVTVRETVSIPPKLAQIIVNLESFLSLTYHIKVVMYLTSIVLLCWLTGHYYCRTSAQVEAEQRGYGNEEPPNVAACTRRRSRRRATPNGSSASENNPFGDGEMGVNSFTGRQQRLSIGSPLQAGAPPILGGQETADGSAMSPNGLLASAPAGRFRRNPTRPQLRTAEEAITQVAQTNESTSGERANSADSSRSLPPSRKASRVDSLETANSPSLDQAAPIQSAHENAAEPIRSQPASVACFFSKVDDELRARRNKQASGNESSPPTDAPQLNDGQTASGEAPPSVQPARKRRKGWFMNVYSRLVGMLSGIRSSIEDAGQLDVREFNDYQDKRLELLADKIDNWYSSSPLTSETGASEAAPADEQSANTSDREAPMLERDGNQLTVSSDAADMTQPRAEMNADPKFKSKRLTSKAIDGESDAKVSPQSEDVGSQQSADRNTPTLPLNSNTDIASDGSSEESGQSQWNDGGQLTATSPASKADVERNGTTGARNKRSLGKGEPDASQSSGDAARKSDNSGTAALTNFDFSAANDNDDDDDGAPDDYDTMESEEEAARREQDEADKAATLKLVEDALDATDKSQRDFGEAGKRADSAESASRRMTSSELDGRNAVIQEQRPRVTMINSSTSIDSAINSTALNGDDVSGSSFESYVTQVARERSSESARDDHDQLNGAPTRPAPNQSAGDETTLAEAANEQIDESSGAGPQEERQSNKWPASGRSSDTISAAGEQLAGADLPSGGARESLKLATSRRSDLSRAPISTDNGRVAAKLDARNGISGASARKQATSSLRELEHRTMAASANGKPDETSGDSSAKERDQAPNRALEANRAYALGPAAQMKGIVTASGRPIDVGASPPMTKSLIGANSAPDGALVIPNLLLANRGPRHASKRPAPSESSDGRMATFQAGYGGQWIDADGNNILNEKIISHQEQQWARHKKSTDDGRGSVASTQALASNSNQGSANRTTGNHHHQRVQPAGV